MKRPQRPSPNHKWVTTKAVYDKDGNLLLEEGYWYLGPWALATAMNTQNFNAWRFYDDDGGEAASTPLEAADTNHTLTVDSDQAIQLRVRIDEVGGADGSSMDDFSIEYEKNDSGTWSALTGTDSGDGIQAATAGLSNNSATTNRASPNDIPDPGGGSFVAGEQSTDGTVEDSLITASNFTEHVFGIQFNSANVSNNDTFDFRFSAASAVDNNNVEPRITISQTPPAAESPAAFRAPQQLEEKTRRTGFRRRDLVPYLGPGIGGVLTTASHVEPFRFVTREIASRRVLRLPAVPEVSQDVTISAGSASLSLTTAQATVVFRDDIRAATHRPGSYRTGQKRRHLTAKQLPWWSIDVGIAASSASLSLTTAQATVVFQDDILVAREKGPPKALRSSFERRHLTAKQLPWWSIDLEIAAGSASLSLTTAQATVVFQDDIKAAREPPPTHKTSFRRQNKRLPTLEWLVPTNDVTILAGAASLSLTTAAATVVFRDDILAARERPLKANRSSFKRKHLTAKQLPWWSIDVEVSAGSASLSLTTAQATVVFQDDIRAATFRPTSFKSDFSRELVVNPTLEWFAPSDTEISAGTATLTLTTAKAVVSFSLDDELAGRTKPKPLKAGFKRRSQTPPDALPWLSGATAKSGIHRAAQVRAEEQRLSPVIQTDSIIRQDDELILKIIGDFLDLKGRLALVEDPSGHEGL